jgi:hypothetical protein
MKKLTIIAGLVAALIALPFSSNANDWMTGSVALFTNTVNASSATNTASTYAAILPVAQNAGVTLYVTCTATNIGTSNTIVGFDFVGKATNYASTTWPLLITNTMAGSNSVTVVKQLSATDLRNVWGIRHSYLTTTQTNAVTVTVHYEYWY